jgi:hypothetical protein
VFRIVKMLGIGLIYLAVFVASKRIDATEKK